MDSVSLIDERMRDKVVSAWSPLEMCAVGGLLCGVLGRMFGGSPQILFVFYWPDKRENVRRKVGWCPQLTNEHCEVLFSHKCACVYQ